LDRLLVTLASLTRTQKRVLQIGADALLVSLSFIVAMFLRLDHWNWTANATVWLAIPILVTTSLVSFYGFGAYREVVRYLGLKAYKPLLAGVVVSGLVLLIVGQATSIFVPRSVPFIYMLLALVTVGGVRLVMRSLFARRHMRQKTRVAVYGAGEGGRQLVGTLNTGAEYLPVAFIDDDESLHGTRLMSLKVHPPDNVARLINDYGVSVILLALPSASLSTRKAILARLAEYEVEVRTIPGIVDIVSGKATFDELREVTIEDLLGRDPVPPDPALLDRNILRKSVLVTGAGGSIGSELCRQILAQRPRQLLLFDASEYALYAIHQELSGPADAAGIELVPLLGTVQDDIRMRAVFAGFEVDTVFHAAAYKHVPLVEANLTEGICNNVFGTLTVLRAAVEAQVGAFILVSTDKAVRPTNMMGASKRLAELICQACAQRHPNIRVSMVRFGNVLGSSGSVIPLFRKQIRNGGPITVTDPNMTRYFMTINEAAQLVIQAGAMARGGDVFLLNMGEPVRIVDLAMRMARLSGLHPVIQSEDDVDHDIKIVFTGLRPGEKVFEELLVGHASESTEHPRIMRAEEVYLPWEQLEPILLKLDQACRRGDHAAVRDIMLQAPLAYSAMDGFVDPLAAREGGVREPLWLQ
jgi:FlaA1/EpsC-like NDP-sugar epimerase